MNRFVGGRLMANRLGRQGFTKILVALAFFAGRLFLGAVLRCHCFAGGLIALVALATGLAVALVPVVLIAIALKALALVAIALIT